MKKLIIMTIIIITIMSFIQVNAFAIETELTQEVLIKFWDKLPEIDEIKPYRVIAYNSIENKIEVIDTNVKSEYFVYNYEDYSNIRLQCYFGKIDHLTYDIENDNMIIRDEKTDVTEYYFSKTVPNADQQQLQESILSLNYDLEYYEYKPNPNQYTTINKKTGIDFWANVNIVQPREGFYDNIDAFAIRIITDFTRLLTNYEKENIKVDVLLNDVKTEAFDVIYNKIRNTTFYSTNEVQLLIDVPVGFNNVEVIYSYLDVELGRDNVNFTRLEGFIDEDGDGLDDRTGNTYVPERQIDPIVDIEKPEKPGEDANVIEWLKYLGKYIGYIFEVFINSISNFAKNVVSGIGSILGLAEPMFSFISQFFSSMPIEIRTAIIAMFSVSVFLVIMKMIRG